MHSFHMDPALVPRGAKTEPIADCGKRERGAAHFPITYAKGRANMTADHQHGLSVLEGFAEGFFDQHAFYAHWEVVVIPLATDRAR